MSLEIPKKDTKSISVLHQLPSGEMDAFIAALRDSPPIAQPKEMAARLSAAIPSIPIEQLQAVTGTLYTLYHIRELAGVNKSEFLDDLMGGVERIRSLKLDEAETARLKALFDRLLSIDSLRIVAKAAKIQRDGERLYRTAKLLSDIRPVFGRDPGVAPEGAVLTHTLRIGYHEGSDHKEFHVVLDSNDLDALGKAIQRAKAKEKSLREFMNKVNLRSLE